MKAMLKVLSIVVVLILLVSLIALGVLVCGGYGISEGRFYKAENGSALLLDDNGATVLSSKNSGIFDNLAAGDRVLVLHDGVEECYPARTGAYFCICLEKGGVQDLPKSVMHSLKELGWISDDVEPEPTPDVAVMDIPFSAQYIRTNGSSENIPCISVITSLTQLQQYYENNKHIFDLERKQEVYSDTTIGFLDACDQYDDAFFEENILLLVTLEEGSGSVRHEVTAIEENAVYIKSIVPECGTADMAQWHILIAVPASSGMGQAEDISVIYDGKDITEKYSTAFCENGYGRISIPIPEGWEYQVSNSTEVGMSCSIGFWPAGYDSGMLTVTYIESGWGVCGTGLREEEITVGDYHAYAGYYGSVDWDYIAITELPGTYVIQKQGKIDWWTQYGAKAMEILNTISLKEDYITQNTAIETAVWKLGKEEYGACEDVWAVCDTENGVWRIEFYRNTQEKETVSVVIDFYGQILEVPE